MLSYHTCSSYRKIEIQSIHVTDLLLRSNTFEIPYFEYLTNIIWIVCTKHFKNEQKINYFFLFYNAKKHP